jgi:V8-like Glu-specific endopeptidase
MTPNGAELRYVTPVQEENLCPSERFAQQISTATCSGALVGPNIVLTAGHCIQNQTECNRTFIGFDYLMVSPSQLPLRLPAPNVYRCQKILAREYNENVDYALLELDRVVRDRPYFQFDLKKEVRAGEKVFAIGHPIGLPAKFCDGLVRDAADDDLFDTTLDTFEGSSGSPVFSLQNGLIVGILVDGENDFVKHGSCNVSKRCRINECKGEQVVRITSILASYYKKSRP